MIDISLKNVKKSFGGTDILKGVTFDVNEGERVALLGANGAGKTTLLKLLTGQLEPDEGEIFLAPRKRVGLISQIPVYPEEYTTEDVLRSAIRHLDELRARMGKLEELMAEQATDRILREYDALGAKAVGLQRAHHAVVGDIHSRHEADSHHQHQKYHQIPLPVAQHIPPYAPFQRISRAPALFYHVLHFRKPPYHSSSEALIFTVFRSSWRILPSRSFMT